MIGAQTLAWYREYLAATVESLFGRSGDGDRPIRMAGSVIGGAFEMADVARVVG